MAVINLRQLQTSNDFLYNFDDQISHLAFNAIFMISSEISYLQRSKYFFKLARKQTDKIDVRKTFFDPCTGCFRKPQKNEKILEVVMFTVWMYNRSYFWWYAVYMQLMICNGIIHHLIGLLVSTLSFKYSILQEENKQSFMKLYRVNQSGSWHMCFKLS